MATSTTRTTFTLDEAVAELARRLGVNVSAAARDGVITAVRAAQIARDREAYQRQPETADDEWATVETWGDP